MLAQQLPATQWSEQQTIAVVAFGLVVLAVLALRRRRR